MLIAMSQVRTKMFRTSFIHNARNFNRGNLIILHQKIACALHSQIWYGEIKHCSIVIWILYLKRWNIHIIILINRIVARNKMEGCC